LPSFKHDWNVVEALQANIFGLTMGFNIMKFSLRTSTLALALMAGALAFAAPSAEAKPNFMKECSAKFKAAKDDGSIAKDSKFTEFMKAQCKADTAADATAPAETAPVAKPVKMTKPAKKPDATTATTTPSGSFMQDCSAAWKALKTNNTVPAGMTWKLFVAGKCVAAPAAAPATTTAAKAVMPDKPAKAAMSQSFIDKCGEDWKAMKLAGTVPEGLTWKAFVIGKCTAKPAAATTTAAATGQTFMEKCSTDWKAMKVAGTVPEGMAWKDFISAKCVVAGATPVVAKKPAMKTKPAMSAEVAPAEPTAETEAKPVKLADKNGKLFTPGQLAAHDRARTCGAKWRAEKEAGTLEAGLKWPQYWSSCNKELKAASQ
jgi:hypothetical protein